MKTVANSIVAALISLGLVACNSAQAAMNVAAGASLTQPSAATFTIQMGQSQVDVFHQSNHNFTVTGAAANTSYNFAVSYHLRRDGTSIEPGGYSPWVVVTDGNGSYYSGVTTLSKTESLGAGSYTASAYTEAIEYNFAGGDNSSTMAHAYTVSY